MRNLSFKTIASCRLAQGVLVLLLLGIWGGEAVRGAVLKAEYHFNGSLVDSVSGTTNLVSIDPLGQNHFTNDTVNGVSQTVFTWVGNATPVTQQAGLLLAASGLVGSNNYSVEMVFKLTDRANGWRRLVDVSDRQSDNGFYVDTGNHLAIYPVISSVTLFANNAYEDVVLVVSNGLASAALNGVQQFANGSLMNITDNLIFFQDNNVGGGQGEFSNGSIALLRLYDLTPVPQLTSVFTQTNPVALSWPGSFPGYQLQQNADLSTTNWQASSLAVTSVGTNNVCVVPSPTGQMFFRLYHP